MVLLLKKIILGYFWLFNDVRDPRSDRYPLMSSPFLPISIGVFYLYLIYKFLPEFMKNRAPYNLDKILIGFNLIQVLVNGYISYNGILEFFKLNWGCAPIDFSDTPHGRFILNLCFLYFSTKLADLLDTIFFILRGKTSQVSFLHVYHHFGMIALGWVGVKFVGGGHSIFLGALNSVVHTVMYSYYLVTIWKPEYGKNLWWKKHITQVQLVQFFLIFIIFGQLLFKPDCKYPVISAYFMVPQSVFMMALFGDFYWKTYIKSKNAQKLQ